MSDIYSVIHSFLNEIMSISSNEELDEIASRYEKQLGGNKEAAGLLWDDIVTLGKELIYLKTGSDDEAGRGLMATLSEQEITELREADRIIDNNLFDYHFQPIVSVATGEVFSYEALMRPRSDLLKSPLQVIEYADMRNRLNDIERATLFNILGILEKDPGILHGKKVFINSIPGTVLPEPERNKVDELLTRHNNVAVIEITEKSELDEDDYREFKKRLEEIGVQTAIDDYGTGYSNVQNLLRYMPDYVKIDRSLLSDMQNDSKKKHFVREIIDFCHSNKILALAEGVETSEELRAVILLGADLIQGFHTAKPAAEPVETIPFDIREEIKNYLHERQAGVASQVYDLDIGEHVETGRLVKNGITTILIAHDGEFSITGDSRRQAALGIEIADGVKCELTVENIKLVSKNKIPCIVLGNDCEVDLELVGENNLSMGGIRVPKSSTFTLKGDGNLSIELDDDEYFGIGAGVNEFHGSLIFDHSGALRIDANGNMGVCIGSGYGGDIALKRGQYVLEMNGDRALGIGTLYNDVSIDVDSCDINIELNTIKGTAIGCDSANSKVTLSNSSVKIFMSGNEAVGIGSITGEKTEVYVHDASLVLKTHDDRCSGVAALDGTTLFKLERASLRVYAKGDRVLPFGGFTGDTDLTLINSDTTVKINTAIKLREYLPPERIEIQYGRARVVLNGFEYDLKD